ncbi:unnamed protein product [Gongylonema pulchrum]|uniref:N(6)-adenine-specific DNA methyltransferase 2 n=1 Tax=Gongylonema pulchrum TaxID=637853 RepID=A0A183E6R9_9BILA|nr:unnamed protein product [Gongylonema pulchrum]
MECCPDGDDDDDEPTLSAEAIAALAEFYAEKNALTKTTVDEDWQRITSGHATVRLFEYDRRFLWKFPEEFVFYDYNEPLKIQEDCRNAFDLVVIDPPFLSDECLVKMAQTVRMLASGCQSKLLICTGAAMTDLVSFYAFCAV